MMRKKIACLLSIIALGVYTSLANSAQERPLVRFSLKTDKQIYEKGEEIKIFGLVKNLSSQVMYVQTKRPFLNAHISLKTPSGKIFEPVDDRGPFYPSDYSAVLAGEEIEFFNLNMKANHLINSPNDAGLEPFQESGSYEISYTYTDLNPLLKKALNGVFSSSISKITIVSLDEIEKQQAITKAATKKTPAKRSFYLNDKPSPTPDFSASQEQAIVLATKLIDAREIKPKEKREKMNFLFISDAAENGYWVVGFEEEKSKIFHAVKVDTKTGIAEEIFFID